MGPYTGVNVNTVLEVRPVQEMEGEACTGGGEERPVQEVVRKARSCFNRKRGRRWMYRICNIRISLKYVYVGFLLNGHILTQMNKERKKERN